MGPGGGGSPQRGRSPAAKFRGPGTARAQATRQGGGAQDVGMEQLQNAFPFFGWFDDVMCGGSRGCPCGSREVESAKISIDRSSSLWTEIIDEPCGVGITFRYNAFLQRFEVQSLIPRGPAFHSGEVEEGDILMSADATDTIAIPIQDLAKLLIGVEGSQVTLHFKRAVVAADERGWTPVIDDASSYVDVAVTLTRRPVDSLLDVHVSVSPVSRKGAFNTPGHGRDTGSPRGDSFPQGLFLCDTGRESPLASLPQAPQFRRKRFVGVKDS